MQGVGVRSKVDELLGTVVEVMQPAVVVLNPGQSLREAARALEGAGVSGAPVLDEGRLVGVVTLGDLFRAAGVEGRYETSGPWLRYEHVLPAAGQTVGDVMTSPAVTLPSTGSVSEAAEVMQHQRINRIPIVDSVGVLRGIVARDDIVAAVAGAARRVHAGERFERPRIRPD